MGNPKGSIQPRSAVATPKDMNSYSINIGDQTRDDQSSFYDLSDTAAKTATSMATIHRPSRHFTLQNYSLAKPPVHNKQQPTKSVISTLENHSPSETRGPPAMPANRDRFIAKANAFNSQPGGLAEACGIKTNRILEYGTAPPMQKKYSGTEFVSMYAQYRPQPAVTSDPTRKIANKPAKILDAPGIIDDFYANIIDWSQSLDCMAIGLGSTVYCWDAQTSDVSVIADLDPDSTSGINVTAVKWSNEDSCLCIATSKGDVQIWDAGTGTLVRSMRGRNCERIAALSWNEPFISSGGRNGSIWNHDIRIKNHKVAELRAHTGEVCGLQWRRDGRMLASGGNDNTVALWDARVTSVPKHQMTSHQAAVKALAWSPWQSNLLATGGGTADRQIHFWNAASGHCINSIDAGAQVTSLHWNSDYREISATLGYPFNSIGVWSYPSLLKRAEIANAHDSRILDATLSMDGQTLVTCSADENIKFWNLFAASPKQKREPLGSTLGSSFVPSRV